MNSRQLQYAIILSETRNFSYAAEKIGVSQPAFSKQILNLENEIGIKLFDRSTNPLSLTAAGEFFVEKAKEIVFLEDVLVKTLEKYKTGEKGRLVIGAVPFRSSYMMPGLIKALKDRYPHLKIVLEECGLSELEKGLNDGEYDFAIMNLPINNPHLEAIPLEEDTLTLAVPKKYAHLVKTEKEGEIDDFSLAKDVPFVTVRKEQEMRRLFDALCIKAGIEPDIYATVTGVATAWEVVKSGVAATIIPKQFIEAKDDYKNVEIFKIKNTPYVRRSAVVLRRGQFVSEYAEFAIEELKKM